MATTVLYRKSSDEVLKISLAGQQFVDNSFFGQLTDPTTPDGTDVHDPNGNFRVLGYAKIAEIGSNNVRNATQAEIDAFSASEVDDLSQMDADRAETLLNTHPQFRKLMTAYSDILKDEFNHVRSWITDFKVEVAAATSLADLKSRVAALPNLPDRTLAQLKTAMTNRISKND